MHSHADLHAPEGDPRIAYFNGLAARWDSAGQDPSVTICQLAERHGLLGLKSGDDLLEVGCGTGQISGWLAAHVAPGKVVAVDFAEAMLEQARRKNLPVEFRCADACCTELGSQCFDVVLCFHSFPHFRDPSAALKNLTRALRTGGRLLVMHLASSAQINAFHDHVGGAVAGDHLPSNSDWESLLAGSGLRIQKYHDRDGLFFLAAGPDIPADRPRTVPRPSCRVRAPGRCKP